MKRILLPALGLSLAFSACNKKTSDPQPVTLEAAKSNAVNRYADLVLANSEENLTTAKAMQTAINNFLAAPSQQGLEAAREAWRTARVPFSKSEAFRFYGGPMDEANGMSTLVNGWPLDEKYIDYVAEPGTDNSIIARADLYPTITPALLVSLNGKDGDFNFATGFHAIEFLLWGQDLNANPTDAGMRPYTDYTTGPNAERRKQYLSAATTLLITHLTQVRDAWKPGAAYHTEFTTSVSKDEALRRMLRGVAALAKGKTGGDRILLALQYSIQEGEESCFSDNSMIDMASNVQGMIDVYKGLIAGQGAQMAEGKCAHSTLAMVDKAKADAVLEALEAAKAAVAAVPGRFDHAIMDPTGREKLQAVSNKLSVAADKIVEAAASANITVSAQL